MKLYITGVRGFLGSHLRVRLLALGHSYLSPPDRSWLLDPAAIVPQLSEVDAVIHIAGVNRGSDSEILSGNQGSAQALSEALRLSGRDVPIVFSNSIQCASGSAYGEGKLRAAEILSRAADSLGAVFSDLRFPNLFGEGGKPFYNSVVATFCHEISRGRSPVIIEDRELVLLHAQQAAQLMIDAIESPDATTEPASRGTVLTVSALGERIADIAQSYGAARIPGLPDTFTIELFNTYKSYLFPQEYPMLLRPHADRRGVFYEAVQAGSGSSQTSFSTTEPLVTRGNHFHLSKVERFLVVEGSAVIRTRHVLGDRVYEFAVDGDKPVVVDMPTFHAHSITNVGNGKLLTLFWSNEVFDPGQPDTYACDVITQ